MTKINFYLFKLTNRYIIVNLIIVSSFILFINLLELSRIISEDNKNIFNYFYYSILKYPSILNEVVFFVIIISISFLVRNLINNNELISMRNLGFSIFDIFFPIGISVFFVGLFFLFVVNPISVFTGTLYDVKLDNKENSLYSIKISDNEMWIKNKNDNLNSSFINIKNIDLKKMHARNIKILLINDSSNKFILANSGDFDGNIFKLNSVKIYDFKKENYESLDTYQLIINFNERNIVNSISKYKLIPFYKYFTHTQILSKFNLYSSEIGLYYLSEIFKPLFLVVISLVMLGFTGKFQRNENFFKVLFLSISIGFIIFLFKEIISNLTISLSINIFFSYFIIFTIPFVIGLFQIIKNENE